jgi:Ohr subfamily peroxiredoxin
VHLRPPGSGGGGTNPEQLFAIGYAACFEGALGAVARRQKIELGEVTIDATVHLQTTEDRAFEIAAALHVTLPGVGDRDRAVEVVAAAHQVCPYSRATRGNIAVELTVNGRTVKAV